MDRDQRRARAINSRKARPIPRPQPARVPTSVLSDLDAIDAATDNPTIHAATTRIRAALDGAEQPSTPQQDGPTP